jgi:hypothetical protein
VGISDTIAKLIGKRYYLVMRTIDVHDLPEPVAKAIELMVETIRSQVAADKNGQDRSINIEIPAWPGTIIGRLRRAEIYDDAR